MPSEEATKQHQYAANLAGTSMGMALYEPIRFRNGLLVGRVGDVAYFDAGGDYKWICNAFNSEVSPVVIQTNQSLARVGDGEVERK